MGTGTQIGEEPRPDHTDAVQPATSCTIPPSRSHVFDSENRTALRLRIQGYEVEPLYY